MSKKIFLVLIISVLLIYTLVVSAAGQEAIQEGISSPQLSVVQKEGISPSSEDKAFITRTKKAIGDKEPVTVEITPPTISPDISARPTEITIELDEESKEIKIRQAVSGEVSKRIEQNELVVAVEDVNIVVDQEKKKIYASMEKYVRGDLNLGMPDIWGLTTSPDGLIYGVTSTQHQAYDSKLFVFNPETNESKVIGAIGDEMYSLEASRDGMIYLGTFMGYHTGENAHFLAYDPSEEWNPGSEADSNPMDLGSLMSGNTVVCDLVEASDNKIYIAVCLAHGGGSGGLFVYAPATSEIKEISTGFSARRLVTAVENLVTATGIDTNSTKVYGSAATGEDFIFSYDYQSEIFERIDAPAASSALVLSEGIVYFTREDGSLYEYDITKELKGTRARTGTKTRKRKK